eukprot:10078928-Heterocapsa_arctica.AAC.1
MQALIGVHMKIKWGDEFTRNAWVKYLGHEWRRIADGIVVRVPPRYYDKILESMMMKDCKPVSSPAVGGAYSQEQQTTPLTSEDAPRY